MVLINGLPAARVGSQTLDGGQILDGEESVLIGGDTFSVPGFISIERGKNDDTFQAEVLRDLFKIGSTPSGKKLLASMAASGHTLTIRRGSVNHTETNPRIKGVLGEENDPRATDGRGVNTTIVFDPNKSDYNYASDVTWARSPNSPSDSQLFHEMVHADDMSYGRIDRTHCRNVDRKSNETTSNGELRAAGVGPYADESQYPYSENTYRRDRGYPRRTFY